MSTEDSLDWNLGLNYSKIFISSLYYIPSILKKCNRDRTCWFDMIRTLITQLYKDLELTKGLFPYHGVGARLSQCAGITKGKASVLGGYGLGKWFAEEAGCLLILLAKETTWICSKSSCTFQKKEKKY